ncbi:hypothetical protein RvY_12284 [Ramazzottius varieornatus]|uniref:Peptidase C1A papain C-terminal domain-containing protein n=1 Tax=Ramazzottius varieornatus TaxID=947166 RepID=A0A1D1VLA8_RAMVA|nr:hypothetical protein RvY_12284 [Ramazzottius varieornatus]
MDKFLLAVIACHLLRRVKSGEISSPPYHFPKDGSCRARRQGKESSYILSGELKFY